MIDNMPTVTFNRSISRRHDVNGNCSIDVETHATVDSDLSSNVCYDPVEGGVVRNSSQVFSIDEMSALSDDDDSDSHGPIKTVALPVWEYETVNIDKHIKKQNSNNPKKNNTKKKRPDLSFIVNKNGYLKSAPLSTNAGSCGSDDKSNDHGKKSHVGKNNDNFTHNINIFIICLTAFVLIMVSAVALFKPSQDKDLHRLYGGPLHSEKNKILHPPSQILKYCDEHFTSKSKVGLDLCRSFCQPASCCFHSLSCLEENPLECKEYFEPCHSFFEEGDDQEGQSDNDYDGSISITKSIDVSNLCEDKSSQKCQDLCQPARCCFLDETDQNSCRMKETQEWCEIFSPCGDGIDSLVTFVAKNETNVSPSGNEVNVSPDTPQLPVDTAANVKEENDEIPLDLQDSEVSRNSENMHLLTENDYIILVKEACTEENVLLVDGRQSCLDLCKQRRCCFPNIDFGDISGQEDDCHVSNNGKPHENRCEEFNACNFLSKRDR